MNHNLKEKMLPNEYEFSQVDVAEKLFLAVGTVSAVEKRALAKLKVLLEQKGITAQNILGD